MPDPAYIIGEVARLSLRVADLTGLAADPGSVTLKIKPGAGAVADYLYGSAPEVVRDGAGLYHADIELTAAGLWAYRWQLTTPNAGAAEGVINVSKSRVI
jgi:hypothetical protein